MIKESG